MRETRAEMWGPVLIGGLAAGVLAGVPWFSCFCCLWILAGSAASVWLYAKGKTESVSPGDGAVIGAFAGVTAAAANTVMNVVFQAANLAFLRRVVERLAANMENFPAEWRDWINREPGPVSIPQLVISLAFSAAVFAALGALGGVLGAALFGKKPASPSASAPPPPAVPPNIR